MPAPRRPPEDDSEVGGVGQNQVLRALEGGRIPESEIRRLVASAG